MVESAQAAGALGARMTGGGFGGSAIVLVEVADADAVAKCRPPECPSPPRGLVSVSPAVPGG